MSADAVPTKMLRVKVMMVGHSGYAIKFKCTELTDLAAQEVINRFKWLPWIHLTHYANVAKGGKGGPYIELSCKWRWLYRWMLEPITRTICIVLRREKAELIIREPLQPRSRRKGRTLTVYAPTLRDVTNPTTIKPYDIYG